MRFLWSILIGILAGWLASRIMKGRSSGILMNLILGIIGAVLGGILFDAIGLQATNSLGSLLSATVGAVVFIGLLRIFSGDRR